MSGVEFGSMQPNGLIVPKSGCSVVYKIGCKAPLNIVLDGEKHVIHTAQELDEKYSTLPAEELGNIDFSVTQDWVELKYSKSEGNSRFDTMTLTIAPNNTGKVRTFGIGFKYVPQGMYRFDGIDGTQLAE